MTKPVVSFLEPQRMLHGKKEAAQKPNQMEGDGRLLMMKKDGYHPICIRRSSLWAHCLPNLTFLLERCPITQVPLCFCPFSNSSLRYSKSRFSCLPERECCFTPLLSAESFPSLHALPSNSYSRHKYYSRISEDEGCCVSYTMLKLRVNSLSMVHTFTSLK